MSEAELPVLDIATEGTGKRFIECVQCPGERWHSVIVRATIKTEVENAFSEDGYEVVRCDGCMSVSFYERSSVGTAGEPSIVLKEVLHPPRRDRNARKMNDGSRRLPEQVGTIYAETILALNNGMSLLAGMGIRALVESVCKHKRIKGRNLKERIDGLADAGILGSTEAKHLHRLRFLGNKAAHEMKQPSRLELSSGLDVADHLLMTAYLLAEKAKRLPSRGR